MVRTPQAVRLNTSPISAPLSCICRLDATEGLVAAFAATAGASNAEPSGVTGIGVYVFDSSTRLYMVLIPYDHVIKSSLLRNSLEPYTAIGAGRWFLGARIEFSRADDRCDQRDGWSVRVYV